jgi:uncharacterized protein (DUF1501 family)
MRFENLRSRRDFMRFGARTIATLGAAAAFGEAGKLAAQTGFSDYKALVCIFLFGGNDANNMLIPNETGPNAKDPRYGYTTYANVRQGLAIPQASLVSIHDSASGHAFGLHPSLAPLGQLYNNKAGRLTLLANVGTLVQPTTKNNINTAPLPTNLFSHSDQQMEWQNGSPAGGKYAGTGWAGRLVDRVYVPACTLSGPQATFGNVLPAVSVAGNSLMLLGSCVQESGMTTGGLTVSGPAASTYSADLNNLLQVSLKSGVTLVQSAADSFQSALEVAKVINAASNSPATGFPNTDIGSQLAQVATLIKLNQTLGAKRQIYFVSQGGYDTHSAELATQGGLLSDLAAAMSAFDTYVSQTLPYGNNVVTFTQSDFSRTFQPNGNGGTDHGWAQHTLIMGPVKGGQIYGTYPQLILSGPDDSADRGTWIPTTPVDQYGVTLANWFASGQLQAADLGYIFPNWPNWDAAGYKFLGFV